MNVNSEKKIRTYMFLIIMSLCLLLVAGIVAKYIHNRVVDGKINAPYFYFTSDKLTETQTTYTVNSDITSISFDIANCADEIRYSDIDINYTITVTGENLGSAILNDGSNTGTQISGTLQGSIVSRKTITLENMAPGITYTVTAVGSNGFSQTISAKFKVMEAGGVYKNTDKSNGAYVLLTVWAIKNDGVLEISFPAGLIPDNTDPVMASIYNFADDTYKAGSFSDSISFAEADTSASHVYRFFKTADYTGATEFTVKLKKDGNEIEAVETGLS